MGDLLALLNEINSTETDMEFCEDFNRLQLILNNTNQFVRSFDRIVFHSGNEPYIIEVVARLLKYLRVQNYLNEENKVNAQYEPELRRITMYLLLNTDVSFRYDLEQDARVNHLLNSLPQLTKCLLMNCIWGLDLDRFFYEMLRYAPTWFSMRFIDQATASLDYGRPYEVLERVESMVVSIYFAICRTDVDLREVNRARHVDQQRTLGKLYDYVVEMLRFFNQPDVTKFGRWSKLRKHRYFGFVVKHMFSMTMACLERYYRRPAIPVDPAMSVYQLMDDRHVHKPSPAEYSPASDATLLKINHCLLNSLEFCIMHVTLERFCYWAEIDLFGEGDETVTLQQVIGESAYRLCEDLKSHKHFRHSILRHLTQFALRPKTLAEKATGLTLGALMARIDAAGTDEDRLVYLGEFLSRGGRVLDVAECLDTIEQHCRLLNGAHVRTMIEYDVREPVGDELEDEEDEEEERDELTDERVKLRELILRAVDGLPASEFERLLCYTLDTFGPDFSRYERPDLVPSIVQLVNRLAEQQQTVPNVQQLLFQSPGKFFDQLVRALYAGGTGTSQERLAEAVVAIIAQHKTIAKRYMRPHLAALLTDEFELCRQPALSVFASRLFACGLFTPVEFMRQFLAKGLAESFQKNNRPALYELIRLYGTICPRCWATDEPNDGDDAAYESGEPKRSLMRTVARLLADILYMRRYHMVLSEKVREVGPDRATMVAAALEQLVATLRQMQKQFRDADKMEFLARMEHEVDASTLYYIHQFLYLEPPPPEVDDLLDGEFDDIPQPVEKKKEQPKQIAYEAFMYRTSLNPFSDEKDILSHLLMVFPRCILPEVLALARDKRVGTYIPAMADLGLTHILKGSRHGGLIRHCASNFIACLLQVLLPAQVKRGRGIDEACQNAIRIVLQHLSTLEPCHDRDQVRAALSADLAELYRYVRTVAPSVDLLDQLKACLTDGCCEQEERNDGEEQQQQQEEEKMEQEAKEVEEKEGGTEDMDTSEKKEQNP
uniref:Uncharacterized protein n=1 Tax=Anopheles coluzzii TaxID=1518534 RepID=A0ABM2AA62_ANOCL|nr:uncharacterized protein LOC120959245 [Anopheles coluzzii]